MQCGAQRAACSGGASAGTAAEAEQTRDGTVITYGHGEALWLSGEFASLQLRLQVAASKHHRDNWVARDLCGKNPLATSAACGLVAYLDLLSHVDGFGLWTLDWVDAAHLMRLDSGAMRALSVEPQPGDTDRHASLLGLFSCCKTAMGARLIRRWLKQPLRRLFSRWREAARGT